MLSVRKSKRMRKLQREGKRESKKMERGKVWHLRVLPSLMVLKGKRPGETIRASGEILSLCFIFNPDPLPPLILSSFLSCSHTHIRLPPSYASFHFLPLRPSPSFANSFFLCALFYSPGKVKLLLSRMETTFKSPPTSDQAPHSLRAAETGQLPQLTRKLN